MFNDTQIEGMEARSAGTPRENNPYPQGAQLRFDWFAGYDMLDARVRQTIADARSMLRDIDHARNSQRRADTPHPHVAMTAEPSARPLNGTPRLQRGA